MNTSGEKLITIALVGNPNAGKSTLFNALTGLNQKTGNFPGVTVDKKSGFFRILSKSQTYSFRVIDLPGTYSLFPKSPDEKVTVDVLLQKQDVDYPDIIISVVDVTNLKRSLLLTTQLMELKIPVLLALNMQDEAEKKGILIDCYKLSELIGLPTVFLNSRKETGIEELKNTILKVIYHEIQLHNSFAIRNELEVNFIESLTEMVSSQEPRISTKKTEEKDTIERFRKISAIIKEAVSYKDLYNRYRLTDKIDSFLTHPIMGFVSFLFVLFFVFQSIFFLAEYPMSWIEDIFTYIGNELALILPKGFIQDLIVNGILAGLSGVVVFVPQIALLFGFISILEDSGYMARVSFMMDKLMRQVGLNGRSVIPLISGVACAVPAIMGTRTIGNYKERIITILVTPLMSCSARLPVYTLLISLMVENDGHDAFFSKKGLYLFLMYLIGFIMALVVAFILNYMIKAKQRSYFIMEMPVYRLPQLKTVVLTIYQKVKVFLVDAGKIIIAVSVLLWWLSSNGPGEKLHELEQKINYSKSIEIQEDVLAQMESEKLENSYVGHIGKFIEPAIKPLGFDWKIGISLITSFVAREVFVGTMATIYSAGSEQENNNSIRDKMRAELNQNTGLKKYNEGVCWSLLIFYAFAMQCISTIAVVYKETGKIKWALAQFIYMGLLAYLSSWVVFNLIF